MAATRVLPGSCASFGWLWLTDLHLGQSSQKWLWPTHRQEFFDDLERIHNECGPWDMVLFTGDLVFSGNPIEFGHLTEALGKLWKHLKTLGSNPYFLCVPGNHDLRRPPADSGAAVALRTSWNESDVQNAFWGKANSDFRKLIEESLKAYTDWLNERHFPAPPDYRPGLLPGEFSATIAKGDARLGIVGLNTTFLQLAHGDYEGKLEIDPRQLETACGGDAAEWIGQRHASLLLTHQPPNWLSSAAQERYRGGIYIPRRFVAHFHGHMHESSGQVTIEGGAAPRRTYQGTSLFGLEGYGEAFEKERFKFGYAACRLEMDRTTGRLYLWPRLAVKQQAGHWRLAQDQSYTLEHGEQYTAPEEFLLTMPCECPGGTASPSPIASNSAAGPTAIGSDGRRKEYLELLFRQSVARCVMRWQSAGTPSAIAKQLAQDMVVGAPRSDMVPTADRPIILLVGPIGAGKSLTGERLHQAAIQRALTAPDAPTPVYLETPSAAGRLDAAVAEAVAATSGNRTRGVALFLHEAVGGETVDVRNLLNEARILANSWPNTTVVLLTRHSSPLQDAREEAVQVPPLSEQQALDLISQLSGGSSPWFPPSWPPSVREAIRRPLFAVLIASYLKENDGRHPQSKADLVEDLVSRALGRISADPTQMGRLLQKLAMLSTDRGGGFVPAVEVAPQHELMPLIDSELVTQRGETIAFPLAILTEWFAARGLAAGKPKAGALLGDAQRLDQWYYPLVIAVGTSSHVEASQMLTPITQNDPGLASKLIEEGVAGWGLAEYVWPPPALECGQRLRDVMSVWGQALGPLAPYLIPFRPDGTLRPLGVATSGPWLSAGWYLKEDIAAPIVALTNASPGIGPLRPGWAMTSLRPGRDPAWAWRWARDNLAESLAQVLRERRLAFDDDLPRREAVWLAAVALTDRPYMQRTSVELAEIEPMLSRAAGEEWMATDRNGRLISLSPLRAEVARLRASGGTTILAPWPPATPPANPDFPEFLWQARSNEDILERVRDVYRACMQQYTRLVTALFPRFAHRFGHAAMLPARMIIEVFLPRRTDRHGTPLIAWKWEPLPRGQESVVDIRLVGEMSGVMIADNTDSRRTYDLFRRLRPEAAPWLSITLSHQGFGTDVLRPDAVRELVYDWLESDLRGIHW